MTLDGIATHPLKQRKVPLIRRTRNGCISCKIRYDHPACQFRSMSKYCCSHRKKKCDEDFRPKCADCRRLNLVCTKAAPLNTKSNLKSVTRRSIIPAAPRESTQSFDADDNNLLAYQDPATGSLNFNHEQPCVLEPTFDSQKGAISTAQTVQIFCNKTSPLSLPFLSQQPPFEVKDPKDQHLLRHFIRTVSRTLSVVHDDDANPFLSLIVPLAGSSKVVMESLLALSASHLRRVYPEILQRGLSHQNEGSFIFPYTQ